MVCKSKSVTLLLSPVLVGTLLLSETATGQTVAAADAPSGTAPADTGLEEIVVSARLRSERWVDVPVAVTAVDPRADSPVRPDLHGEHQARRTANYAGSRLYRLRHLDFHARRQLLQPGCGPGAIGPAGVRRHGNEPRPHSQRCAVRCRQHRSDEGAAGAVLRQELTRRCGRGQIRGSDPTSSQALPVSATSSPPTIHARSKAHSPGPSPTAWDSGWPAYASKSDGYIHNQDTGVPDLIRTAASGSTFVPAAQPSLGAEEKEAVRLTLKYDPGHRLRCRSEGAAQPLSRPESAEFRRSHGLSGRPHPAGDHRRHRRSQRRLHPQ